MLFIFFVDTRRQIVKIVFWPKFLVLRLSFRCAMSDQTAEIIVYNDPAKRKKASVSATSAASVSDRRRRRKDTKQTTNAADMSFSLEKARHEVRQLGI